MNLHLPIFWALGALMMLAALTTVLGRPRRRRDAGLETPWPLERKRTLLSPPEQVLYRRLVAALPEHLILAQVQLLRLLEIRRARQNPGIKNRVSQLSVDFVITGPDTRIIAAVELDDASHNRADRRDADARKTHALKSAGIPLIRWTTTQLPDMETIQTTLEGAGVVRSAPLPTAAATPRI